jgi:hypothetical protein
MGLKDTPSQLAHLTPDSVIGNLQNTIFIPRCRNHTPAFDQAKRNRK